MVRLKFSHAREGGGSFFLLLLLLCCLVKSQVLSNWPTSGSAGQKTLS